MLAYDKVRTAAYSFHINNFIKNNNQIGDI